MRNVFRKLVDSRIAITLAIFLGFLCWSSYSVYVLNQTYIYAENGPLENFQVFILIIACIVFFLPIVYQKRDDKLFLLILTFLCLSFVLREVDVEDLDVPNVLKFIGAGIGRNVIFTAGFIAMFSFALFNFKHYKDVLIKFLISKSGVLIITAGLLLGLSRVIEIVDFSPHKKYVEELSELAGYVLILLTAFIYTKHSIKRAYVYTSEI